MTSPDLMSDRSSALPPLPSAKRKSRWRWLKIIVGIVAGGFLVIGLLVSINSPKLELKRIGSDGKGVEVINVGTKPIAITKITINDRADCSVNTLGQAFDKMGRLQSGVQANPANDQFRSETLAVGEKATYLSSCLIIRAEVETDSGTATYSFKGN